VYQFVCKREEKNMEIRVYVTKNFRAVIQPEGRVDAESSPQVKKTMQDAVKQGAIHMVVDLSKVTFMDSSGLSVLVSGLKLVRMQHGMLVLTRPNAQIQTALKLTMLDRVFKIYNTIEDAFIAMEIK